MRVPAPFFRNQPEAHPVFPDEVVRFRYNDLFRTKSVLYEGQPEKKSLLF